MYLDEKGGTSIVGPVVKKNKNGTHISYNNKPRDHPQLHSNRPGIVTLLCLARDAASRLPDGVGTRADILELIKHSQWLKIDGIDPNQLNNIVSGALDRLHYEPDPCVKYGADNKLWIYLHKDRKLDHEDWEIAREPNQEVFHPNCLQNNAVSLDLMTENFADTLAKENPDAKESWMVSEHKENESEELKKQLEQQRIDEDNYMKNKEMKQETALMAEENAKK